MVDSSRRAIMRGAAGLGAVFAGSGQAANTARAYTGPQMLASAGRGLMEGASDYGISEAKQIALNLAQQEMDNKRRAIEREQRALLRLRSVSEAWRESRIEHYDRERMSLWDAFQIAQQKIFGEP